MLKKMSTDCTLKKKSTYKIQTIFTMDRSLHFPTSLHEHIINVMLHMHIYKQLYATFM